MVATIAEHEDWLRDGLGTAADEVRFVDMGELGRNPARIIPAWQKFLDGAGAGVRSVGSANRSGRSDETSRSRRASSTRHCSTSPSIPRRRSGWSVPTTWPDSARLWSARPRAVTPPCSGPTATSGSGRYGGRAHIDLMFGGEFEDLRRAVRPRHVRAGERRTAVRLRRHPCRGGWAHPEAVRRPGGSRLSARRRQPPPWRGVGSDHRPGRARRSDLRGRRRRHDRRSAGRAGATPLAADVGRLVVRQPEQ